MGVCRGYADEEISGTNVKYRDELQMMIADCGEGNIDLILIKSITRFATNTVECIQIIRKLKEIGVGIYFEKENINTLLEWNLYHIHTSVWLWKR